MRSILCILALGACQRATPNATVTAASSTPPIPSAIPAWHPHKLSKNDASTFCAELLEGGITSRCVGGADGRDVDVFEIPGRQRTEAHGIIASFNAGGSFERWIEDSLQGDAGVDPIYHYSRIAKMIVAFNGDVPEETKLRVAEALDAL